MIDLVMGEFIGEVVIVFVDVLLKVLVFKIMDDCFGVLIFVCIYLGKIKKGDIIFNSVMGKIECIGCMVEMYVNDCNEVEFV